MIAAKLSKINILKLIRFVLLINSVVWPMAIKAQTTQVEFGKNRIQFHQEFAEWFKYESDNFITYWYGEGRNIGQFVVQSAEYDYKDMRVLLDYLLNDKIQIIVYKDMTDLKQSNIGQEDVFVNTSGKTKFVGNKFFVYFNGDHTHLRKQIREGIAAVYLNSMLFGSNLQEIVQNVVSSDLPLWFTEGLISFAGDFWNVDMDDQLKDMIQSGRFEDFYELAESNPRLAGHSFWYYIYENQGISKIKSILYYAKIHRDVAVAIHSYSSTDFNIFIRNLWQYFQERYNNDTESAYVLQGQALSIKNKRNLPLYQFSLSADAQKFAYVSNEQGRYKVYIQDINSGDRKLIHKGNYRNAFQATDYNYPLLDFSPDNQHLSVIYEKNDVIKYLKYNYLEETDEVLDFNNQYHRVYSIDHIDASRLVLSATVKGHSDIFIYSNSNNQTKRITNDYWDDLDATAVNLRGKLGIIFSSNREDSVLAKSKLDTVMPYNNFDLFYYDLSAENPELTRLTNTPLANEFQAMAVDTFWFSYLTDQSGTFNQASGFLEDYLHHYDQTAYLSDGTNHTFHADSLLSSVFDSVQLAMLDSVIQVPIIKQRAIAHKMTNSNRNITELSKSPRTSQFLSVIRKDQTIQVYKKQAVPTDLSLPKLTIYRKAQIQHLYKSKPSSPNIIDTKVEEIIEDKLNEEILIDQDTLSSALPKDTIDIDNYFFQSEYRRDQVEQDQDGATQIIVNDPSTPTPSSRPKNTVIANQSVIKFNPSHIVAHRLQMRTDYLTTSLDNEPLFDGLNSFIGTPIDFGFQTLGLLIKGNLKNLFEDYEIQGGVRIPTTFNGTEYFLVVDDRKKRLDKRYAVYRRALRFTDNQVSNQFQIPQRDENTLIIGQFQVRYPFSIYSSLRGTATLRFDQTTPLSTELDRLQSPIHKQQRAGLRAEYVFDNTLVAQLNILNGTRYKVFTEVYKRFNINLNGAADIEIPKGILGVLGIDVRHYQRVLKYSIIAGRLSAQTSFGAEKILYMIGGTDNWLFSQFNENTNFDTDQNYAFQSIQNNLRGFSLNIRNGNSVVLTNIEFRVPIFRYLSKNIRQDFFKNFQFVTFFDAGTAFAGLNPFDENSPLNSAIVTSPNNPVTLDINYFRDPIVYGFGAGLRANIFGYFLRFDYAHGVETGAIQKRKLYLALGHDF